MIKPASRTATLSAQIRIAPPAMTPSESTASEIELSKSGYSHPAGHALELAAQSSVYAGQVDATECSDSICPCTMSSVALILACKERWRGPVGGEGEERGQGGGRRGGEVERAAASRSEAPVGTCGAAKRISSRGDRRAHGRIGGQWAGSERLRRVRRAPRSLRRYPTAQ